jgi:hypothetical protein
VKIPFVCGSGAYAYTYKMHWQGAQHWFMNAKNTPPKRLIFTGTAGLSNIEYIGNHVCSSKTVTHSVYHNAEYPSRLLLPVIPIK